MDNIPSQSIINLESSKQKISWRYQFQQYGIALAAAAILFIILSLYHFYRHGYYDLSIANKNFALAATALLGIVILIGPGSRLFSFPDRYVQYRKELGIVAFSLALIHSIASFFFLQDKFTTQKFLSTNWWTFIFGLIAIAILIAIFFISNNRAVIALGREK